MTRFIPADALWAFCMACNVYLTLFRRYDTSQLRKLEWKYCIVCYGLPFVPAFVYLFIETEARGKIYGPLIVSLVQIAACLIAFFTYFDYQQWCWVRSEWAALRIAIVFGPVWCLIVLSAAIYISAGREILKSRRQLNSFAERSSQSSPMTQNQFDFSRATDVQIADEADSTPVQGTSNLSPDFDPELDRSLSPRSRYPSDPVDIESRTAISSNIAPFRRPQRGAKAAAKRRRAPSERHTLVWAYTKFAILFLLALFVTWVCLFIGMYHIIELKGLTISFKHRFPQR